MSVAELLEHLKVKGGLHGATLNVAINPAGDFVFTFVQVVVDKDKPKVAGVQLNPSLLAVMQCPPEMVSVLCKSVAVDMPKVKK